MTHFSPISHFYIPWKRQKTIGFLPFSGRIVMWHWTKMGQRERLEVMITLTGKWCNSADTGRKLNVHKTFRRDPERLLNVLCTFNLRPVSTRKDVTCYFLGHHYFLKEGEETGSAVASISVASSQLLHYAPSFLIIGNSTCKMISWRCNWKLNHFL